MNDIHVLIERARSFISNFDGYNSPFMSVDIYWTIPFTACVVYLGMLTWCQVFPKGKLDSLLHYPLVLWNLFLSIFSAIIFVVWGYAIVNFFLQNGAFETICDPHLKYYAPGNLTGFCAWLFTASKLPELVDTVFLVLRGRDVPFLHSYHHVTVLLFAWWCVYATYAPGQLFGLVNSFVHTIMYFYYCLTAATGKRYWWGAIVTQIQIIQMFIGLGLAITWGYFQFVLNSNCGLYRSNSAIAVVFSSLLYGTYLILFLKLHFTRNVAPRVAKSKSQ